MNETARRYLESLPSDATRRVMRQGLERVESLVGRRLAWERLTAAHVQALRARVVEAYTNRQTILCTFTALRGVLRAAGTEGAAAPLDLRLNPLATPGAAGRTLAPGEVDAVFRWIDSLEGVRAVWLRAIFTMMIKDGVRSSEIVTMIDVEAPAGAAVDAWRVARVPQMPWLFTTVLRTGKQRDTPLTEGGLRTLCRAAARGAVIAPFTPTDCRRTFCSNQQ